MTYPIYYINSLTKSIVLLMILNLITLSQTEYFEECEGYEAETFLPSSNDCSQFIYCDDEDSQVGACPDGLHFDATESMCAPPEEANCRIGLEEEDEEDEEIEEIEEVTTTLATTTTTRTSSTTTTTQASTTEANTISVGALTTAIAGGSNPMVTINAVTNVRENCPVVDNANEVVLVASKQSCGVYYLCQHGQAIELRCSDHLHFNANTGRCDFPANVGCLMGRPNATVCGPNTTDFFPHSKNCNYFYYCIRGFLTLQQCPFFYGWDVERRSCTMMSQAKCFNN